MKHSLRFRQVHLDFHTAPSIPGIGKDFDPEEFALTLKNAHVDSITCFSRCHHGWFYYDSKRFPERIHPNLTDKDLLKKQIEACHKYGIKVPVYTTVQWDEQIAKEHREWLVSSPTGGPYKQEVFKPGFYRNLCLNTGYVDYLKEQILDVFECLGMLDGLFLDILNIQPCCCPNCLKEMLERGMNPEDETQRYEFAQEVMDRFKEDMTRFIHEIQPDCPVFYNAGFISSRHRKALDSFTHLEIESLPGGSWGYDHFPVTARYTRTLGLDFMGMTGKFHTDWGDFSSFRSQAALEYECFKSLAYGGKCSIGDQLPPNGKISAPVYDLIGKVYAQVEEKEPWCVDAAGVVEAGILIPEEFLRPGTPLITEDLNGAVKLLTQLGLQFDVIDSMEDFSKYRLLVLPDHIPTNDVLAGKIAAFLENGGSVIASYVSGMDGENQKAASWLPVEYECEAPFSPDFIIAEGMLGKGLYDDTEYVMYDKAVKVSLKEGAEELLKTNIPYANRTWDHYCSHRHFPSAGVYGYPGAAKSGKVIYFAHPLFTTFQRYGCGWIKTMVENAVNELLPERLVTYQGPSTLEVVLEEQKQESRQVLHFLHYIPQKRAEYLDILEDVIPLYQIPVSVKENDKKITSIKVVPEGREVPFVREEGRVVFQVPEVKGHTMLEMCYE